MEGVDDDQTKAEKDLNIKFHPFDFFLYIYIYQEQAQYIYNRYIML